MTTRQTIAIIGATGNLGAALAKSIAPGNYRLVLFADEASKAMQLESEIKAIVPEADIASSCCPYEATWEADVIIPVVPPADEIQVAQKIKEVATQKIVVSVSNPATNTFGTSLAERLQQLLPDSRVVKAFNTNGAGSFTSESQADCFVAGDDREAVSVVMELANNAGFRAIDAGPLSASRTLEQMGALLIKLSDNLKYGDRAGWKLHFE